MACHVLTFLFSSFQEIQKLVTAQRKVLSTLDNTGTHMKYFSQKPDVILIKNLLVNTQNRWDKVVTRSSERTRQLDLGYKQVRIKHGREGSTYGINYIKVNYVIYIYMLSVKRLII